MFRSRAWSTLALVVGLLLLPAPVPAATSSTMPTGAAPSAGLGPGDPRDTRRDLVDDVVRPAGPGLTPRIRTWPGKTIRYYESIPGKWDWSLNRAIQHWNSSGGRMDFVEVSRPGRAQLVIKYGETWGADGVATLGPTPNAFVHLSPAYKDADPFVPEIRVWVGRLFTHELGHVLGFDHTSGQCALMYPVYDFGLCPPLPDDHPGYYFCRWIDKKLLTRFVNLYGGSAQRPPRLCLIEALPGQLRDVAFTGGQTQARPVTISWRPPEKVRDGTRVRILVWKGSTCGGEPGLVDRSVGLAPGARTWTDPAYGTGTWCYRLRIENRYGAARKPFNRALQRYAPVPAAPVIENLLYVEEGGTYRFTWHQPKGTRLVLMRDADDPTQCVTTYDANLADYPSEVDVDTWEVWPYQATECLTFFAVTEWDTVSPPTSAHVGVPAPDVTPTVGPVTANPDDPFTARATATLPDDTYRLGIEVVAGDCPAVPPGDAGWWDGWESEPGVWTFYPEHPDNGGPNCAMFTALDDLHGTHGPVVMRPFAVTWQ